MLWSILAPQLMKGRVKMTTRELIVDLYVLGFGCRCDEDFPFLYVLDGKDNVIASVDMLNFGVLDTTFKLFDCLKAYEKSKDVKIVISVCKYTVRGKG